MKRPHPSGIAIPCVIVMAGLVLAACGIGLSDPVVCTTISVPAIAVTVVDSATGAPAAAGSSLVVVDGAYRDSVALSPAAAQGTVLTAAYERAGTYALTVRQSGYRDWSLAGVQVTADACHVMTRSVTARLQR